MVDWSYEPKAKWKGVRDVQIQHQKDFKRDAAWTVSALIAYMLEMHFSFDPNTENRFVEYCEKIAVTKGSPEVERFEEMTYEMIDLAYRLLHAIARSLLGKKLPKAKGVYTQYDDLFKGPNYEYIRQQVKKGMMKSYQKRVRRTMGELVEFLKNG